MIIIDETLVHSSFQHVPAADYVIPVEIENQVLIFILKRRFDDDMVEMTL